MELLFVCGVAIISQPAKLGEDKMMQFQLDFHTLTWRGVTDCQFLRYDTLQLGSTNSQCTGCRLQISRWQEPILHIIHRELTMDGDGGLRVFLGAPNQTWPRGLSE